LTVQLSPLAATLTKNSRGGGAMVFPGRTSMPVRCHVLSRLFATLRKTAGCVTQLSHSGRGVLPTFKPSSFKPSNDPLVPLQPNALGATIGNDTRIFHDPGKQVRSPPVSNTTRADIGNCFTPLPVTDSDSIGVASRA